MTGGQSIDDAIDSSGDSQDLTTQKKLIEGLTNSINGAILYVYVQIRSPNKRINHEKDILNSPGNGANYAQGTGTTIQ
jgi:hypothetical protein